MSSGIPEMLGEMDEAIRDIWQRYAKSLTPADFVDYAHTCTTYGKLARLRDQTDACLSLLDDLRLEVLPLLPDEEEKEEE